ncbi:MAG: response regulator [Gammaproteobacteria bacterium]|nr:response regulator [Gammaproteobacteria bacterium]
MTPPPLKKILHVDDSDDIRELVRHGLERDDKYTLMFCASTDEAIDRAPTFGPDLLLLDSIMPDISGVGLYEKIRAQPGLENTPVIFLTTQAETLDFTSFLRVGAIDVIGKPFDVNTLADTIDEIWREHWARQA